MTQNLATTLFQVWKNLQDQCTFNTFFPGQNKEPHPFHVKSNWMSLVQPSVALESYLENVKVQLAEITTMKPPNNITK